MPESTFTADIAEENLIPARRGELATERADGW
jgi:hypothetical protein